jgi:uncharacterized membrane protein YgdD (TMEM256/DUF423 family)
LNWIFGVFFSGLLGITGVGAGAFGAHYLRTRLDSRSLESFQTAVHYQMMHAIVLLAVSLLLQRIASGWFATGLVFFVVGTFLFSGSIYLLVLRKMVVLGPVTPVGGLFLMLGWFCILAGSISCFFQFRAGLS